MMRIPAFILVIVFLSGTLSLFAEGKTVSQRITGTWKIDSFTQNGKKGEMKGASVWIEFLPDGTGRAVSQDPEGKREIKQITWAVDGNVLSITEEGKTNPEKPAVVSFNDKGSKLTLDIESDNIIMHASRVSNGDSNIVTGPDGKVISQKIVGTWKLESFTQHGKKGDMRGDKMWIEFFSDGTGRAMRQGAKGDRELKIMRWATDGSMLSITEEGKDEPEKPFIVTVMKGGRRLSMSMRGNDLEMRMVRIPGSIPGLPKKSRVISRTDDSALAARIAGIWRLEESDGAKVESGRWYDLRSDGRCRLIESSEGGTARVSKKGNWVVKGDVLSLRDEGKTEGDDASFVLTDGDSKLELKAKSSDSVLRLVREEGELPPFDGSEDEKSK